MEPKLATMVACWVSGVGSSVAVGSIGVGVAICGGVSVAAGVNVAVAWGSAVTVDDAVGDGLGVEDGAAVCASELQPTESRTTDTTKVNLMYVIILSP
jgi:hypothetical protein